MRKYQITCPYCGAPAICRPASTVFGNAVRQKGSYLYLCSRWPACDSYVAAHKRDLRPMGTLANKDLRRKRILAHEALEKLHRHRHMEKWAVYVWLQGKLGLDPEEVHIGMFSDEMCDKVISLCHQTLQQDRRCVVKKARWQVPFF